MKWISCHFTQWIDIPDETNTFPTRLPLLPFKRPTPPGIWVGEDQGIPLVVFFLQMEPASHTQAMF